MMSWMKDGRGFLGSTHLERGTCVQKTRIATLSGGRHVAGGVHVRGEGEMLM